MIAIVLNVQGTVVGLCGGGVTAGGPTASPICELNYIYSSLCKLIMKDEVEE